MRPNLSVEKIAGALAVLGTTALISACGGGDKPPVNANEVAPSGEKAGGEGHCGADKTHKPGEASCGGKGAGSCGAGKGAGSCGAGKGDAKPGDAKPTDAKPGDAKPTDAKPADTKADAKPTDAK